MSLQARCGEEAPPWAPLAWPPMGFSHYPHAPPAHGQLPASFLLPGD